LLFKECKWLIYCKDDQLLDDAVIQFCETTNKNLKTFSWGQNDSADLRIQEVCHK
jgi:hypothetical protein